MFFETNKCFLLPSAMRGIRGVRRFYEQYPSSEALVVGHTDTDGDATFNKFLSLERAKAVASFLKDDVETWAQYFRLGDGDARHWAYREVQHMLSVLPSAEAPYFDTKVHGIDGMLLTTMPALKAFQSAQGLAASGVADAATQRVLITEYMKADGTTLSAATKLVPHGCGEWFPVKETGDNVANPENRRVELFFFEDEIRPKPPGEYSLPGSPEYAQWLKQVVKTVDFTEELFDLLVRTVDEWQTRIGDVEVTLDGPVHESARTSPVVGDEGAEVIFRDLPAGQYKVHAKKKGFPFAPRAVAVGMTGPVGGPQLAFAIPAVGAGTASQSVTLVTVPVKLHLINRHDAESSFADFGAFDAAYEINRNDVATFVPLNGLRPNDNYIESDLNRFRVRIRDESLKGMEWTSCVIRAHRRDVQENTPPTWKDFSNMVDTGAATSKLSVDMIEHPVDSGTFWSPWLLLVSTEWEVQAPASPNDPYTGLTTTRGLPTWGTANPASAPKEPALKKSNETGFRLRKAAPFGALRVDYRDTTGTTKNEWFHVCNPNARMTVNVFVYAVANHLGIDFADYNRSHTPESMARWFVEQEIAIARNTWGRVGLHIRTCQDPRFTGNNSISNNGDFAHVYRIEASSPFEIFSIMHQPNEETLVFLDKKLPLPPGVTKGVRIFLVPHVREKDTVGVDGIAGLAPVGGGVALIKPKMQGGSAFSHELGHNLGLEHYVDPSPIARRHRELNLMPAGNANDPPVGGTNICRNSLWPEQIAIVASSHHVMKL
jgi:hypothetical protein